MNKKEKKKKLKRMKQVNFGSGNLFPTNNLTA